LLECERVKDKGVMSDTKSKNKDNVWIFLFTTFLSIYIGYILISGIFSGTINRYRGGEISFDVFPLTFIIYFVMHLIIFIFANYFLWNVIKEWAQCIKSKKSNG
jgi:hypothetical protein